MHASTVDFQSGLVNECVVADEIVGSLIGEFDNEIKYSQADTIDRPACRGEDAMICTVVFSGVSSAECAGDISSGCEDPADSEMPERLRCWLGHRGGEDLQKWYERCCNVH